MADSAGSRESWQGYDLLLNRKFSQGDIWLTNNLLWTGSVATKYENYSDEDAIVNWSTPFWQGNFDADFPYQTFTPQITHTISKGKLYLKKTDATAVTLWGFGIYATDITGQPTGSALASMFVGNPSIAQSPFDWQWVDFTLSSEVELTADTMYAMRFHVQLSGAAKTLYWARRGTDVYPRGQIWHYGWSFTGTPFPVYTGGFLDGVAEGDHFFEEWSASSVTWSRLDGVNPIIFSFNGTPYEITPDSSAKKYIYWTLSNPNVFLATDVRATAIAAGNYLVCVNDEGTLYPRY